MTKQRLEVIYDGACPFCSSYVRVVRIRENFHVDLIDARERPDIVTELRTLGHDLGDGMAARLEGRTYYGSEALSLLGMLSSGSGFWNRLLSKFFRNRRLSSVAYPFLRAGRNITLAVMGRKRAF